MSYNGTGTFNINTAGQPVVTGTVISSTAFNALTADLATGLSTAITKDGQTTVTANIPFNNFKLTGIAAATATGDALSYGRAATVTTLVASTSITDSGLTSGRVTYAGTAGLLQDSANLTFDGTYLTANSIKNSALTSGRVTYAGASGLLSDSAGLTWDGTTFAASNVSTGGSVTLSGGTSNGVLYLNGSKVATSGSALTFDGTTLGTNKFTATGDAYTSGGLRVSGSYAVNSANQLALQNSAGVGGIYINGTTTGSGNRGSLAIWLQDSAGANYINPYTIDSSGNSIWSPGGTEQMRLTSTGLGIGTSSPAAKLDVRSGYILAGTTSSTNGSKILGGYYTNGIVSTFGSEYSSGGAVIGYAVWPSTVSAAAFVSSTPVSVSRGAYTISGADHIWYNGAAQTVAIDSAVTTSERMRLDASGNLGLGVTPSAWGTFTALQVGPLGGAALAGVANNTILTSNAYYNGAFKYAISGSGSTYYQQTSSEHRWFTALSGTAGNTISFTQAMTLDASGNLGLGTSSPVYKLEAAVGTAGSGQQFIANFRTADSTASYNAGLQIFATPSSTATSRAVNVVWDADGANASGGDYFYINKLGNSGEVQLWQDSNAAMLFATNATERARITSGGDFLVNTTSASAYNAKAEFVSTDVTGYFKTSASSTVGLNLVCDRSDASGGEQIRFITNGTNVGNISSTASATSYNTSSDYRLKDNQHPLTGSGAFIDALKPKTWDWKSGGKGVGFIAHEVQVVSPGTVTGTKDAVDADGKPVYQSMEYGSAEFIANIIAELQSLRARVAQLESK